MLRNFKNVENRWLRLHGNVRGALWLLMAGFFFSAMGGFVKVVSMDLDSLQVVFFRCIFGVFVLVPFMAREGVSGFKTQRFRLHLFRAFFGLSAMACLFYAISKLPLADALALTFSKPLFMIVAAVVFLKEAVRWRRWTATAVGFVGVLIMLRPGTDSFEPAGLVALFGAVMVAGAMTTIKKMTATERPVTILLWFAVLSSIASAVPAYFVWQQPTLHHLFFAGIIGICGTLGQTFLVRAYAAGEATAVSPFDYSRLVFSGIIGFLFFAEVPDGFTILGASIIVGSTFYIARREAKVGT